MVVALAEAAWWVPGRTELQRRERFCPATLHLARTPAGSRRTHTTRPPKATAEPRRDALQPYSLRLSLYVSLYFSLMTATKPVNLWTSNEHARDYLERADSILHRGEGESALLEFIPQSVRRIFDLGTGDGRLLALVRREHTDTEGVAVDFSPAMLEGARKRFAGQASVKVVGHNLDEALPAMG